MENILSYTKHSAEPVWEILQKVIENQKLANRVHKQANEWRKEKKKIDKEAAWWWNETSRIIKETDRQLKDADKWIRRHFWKLGHRFDELIEYMVMPNLIEMFYDLGEVFFRASPHSVIKDKNNKTIANICITLENSEKVMLADVQLKPTIDDIVGHIERMKKVKANAELYGDKRKYYGIIAGMIFYDEERQFALENGFYVVEPSDDLFTITVPEGAYSLREW